MKFVATNIRFHAFYQRILAPNYLTSSFDFVRNYWCHYPRRSNISSSSPSKLFEYVAKAPQKATPSWTRLAMELKDDGTDSRYLERLRKAHNVTQHITLLEDEIREEMAQALGRTGSKCDYMFLMLERAAKEYEELILTSTSSNAKSELKFKMKLQLSLDKLHSCYQNATKARTELIIHRQSIGLTWRNQKIVEEYYPLPPTPPSKIPT